MPGCVDTVAQMILAGASGEAALATLRETYHTLATLSSAASRVRTAIFATLDGGDSRCIVSSMTTPNCARWPALQWSHAQVRMES